MKHKTILIVAVNLLITCVVFGQFNNPAKSLKVSDDGHHLQFSDGSSFFWMGDTAWELFHRLDKKETDYYLETRAKQGFNVIQAVVLAELYGLTEPNREGNLPLFDQNPEKPNEKYFEHVDYVVKKAADLGIFVAMSPTWGDKWNKQWGQDNAIFNPENAQNFGAFLGNRYKNQWNIIWVMGGDRNPENDEHFKIIRSMAKGLEEGDGGKHLFTYHPTGDNSSSSFFHDEKWLDFNMTQSGHGERNGPNYIYTLNNYNLTPAKPCLDGEPRYEDIPVKFGAMKMSDSYKQNPYEVTDSSTPHGYYNDYDVRRAAYWSVFSGACGHTYGNGSIWCFWDKGRYAPIAIRFPWQKAMLSPGGENMGHLRKLIDQFGMNELVPDRSVVTHNTPFADKYIAALRTKSGNAILAYCPEGQTMRIAMTKLSGKNMTQQWYNPREGTFTDKTAVKTSSSMVDFVPPTKGDKNDWVLVIQVIK